MITVACVYWKGRFRGRENIYTEKWVERLRNMVARNLSLPHQFVCLSNVDVPCERIPLIHDWPGWWSKVELFRPGLFPEGRVLYLDLDLVVLQSLEPFLAYPYVFSAMFNGNGDVTYRERKKKVDRYQSSVMVWDSGIPDGLYEEFREEYIDHYWGDQDYLSDVWAGAGTFPQSWIKKLRYCPGGIPPDDLKIMLCMPGKNEKASKIHSWVKEIWI